MKLFPKTRLRRVQRRRVATIQASCQHDWRPIELFEGDEYKTFRAMMFRTGSPTVLRSQCQKCGKVRFQKFSDSLSEQ